MSPSTPSSPTPTTPSPATTSSVNHAQHNHEACDFLLSDGRYKDWVITTAFYSAMHRVQAHVFPYTDSSGTYVNIAQYANAVSTKERRKVSKHEATKRLVSLQISTIKAQYTRLFGICFTARYVQYQTSLRLAQEARNCLMAIEAACK